MVGGEAGIQTAPVEMSFHSEENLLYFLESDARIYQRVCNSFSGFPSNISLKFQVITDLISDSLPTPNNTVRTADGCHNDQEDRVLLDVRAK